MEAKRSKTGFGFFSLLIAVTTLFVAVSTPAIADSEDGQLSPEQSHPITTDSFVAGDSIVFEWVPYADAIDYDLFIYSLEQQVKVYRDTRISTDVCQAGICSTVIEATSDLDYGAYDWRISARTLAGRTPFSKSAFHLADPRPAIPSSVQPLADAKILQDSNVALTWIDDPDATSYSLILYSKNLRSIVYRLTSYDPADCIDGQCSHELPSEFSTSADTYVWRVASRNTFGRSDYSWSSYSIVPPSPEAPTIVSPSDSIVLNSDDEFVTFEWLPVTGATDFDLLVWNRQVDEIVYRDKTLLPSEVCDDSTCSLTLATESSAFGADGDYVWRIAARTGREKSKFSAADFSIRTNGPANIVFLLADDLGYADLNPVDMPRTYQIAQQYGIELPLFTYQNCAPTRTAAMTGKLASSMGITGVDPPFNYEGLPVSEVLVSEQLQSAGYATGAFGKWHLGLRQEQSPLFNGFDEFVGFTHGWIYYYGLPYPGHVYPDGSKGHSHHGSHDFQRSGAPSHESGYSTFVFADAAVDFINRSSQSGEPYFAYVPFNAPHSPYSAPKQYALEQQERFEVTKGQFNLLYEYADTVLSIPLGLARPDGTAYPFNLLKKLDLMLYHAAVRALDDSVADIFEALIANGDIYNTLFVFASDNGATLSRGGFGSNAPFNAGKGSYYNGGHRVANFAVFPEKYELPETLSSNVWIGDLYETFMQVAEIETEAASSSDRDSTGMLSHWQNGEQNPVRKNGGTHFVIHESKRIDSRFDTNTVYEWAIIDGDYKYVRSGLETPEGILIDLEEELFNFSEDIGEQENLLSDPLMGPKVDAMRDIFLSSGGDAMILGWHTTDKASGEGTVPEEWGFP